MQKKQTGLIHVYTGNGKGKTTAAVGLAVRALSHDLKVTWACFMKQPQKYGNTEIDTLKNLGASVFILTSGHPRFNKGITSDVLQDEISQGLTFLQIHCIQNSVSMLIMDEILIAVRDGYVSLPKLLEFIANKPKNMELVMTGRTADINITEISDYVSEIIERKHPAQQGINSREGIEF